MKCGKCNSEWSTSVKTEKCPFCGEILDFPKPEDSTFSDVPSCFKYIFDKFGTEILSNKTKFLAVISDYMPSLTLERRLIACAFDIGVYKKISAVAFEKIEDEFSACVMLLTENYGITQTHAQNTVNWLIGALYGEAATVKNAVSGTKKDTAFASQSEMQTIEYNGGTYTGELLNGIPHGQGTITYKDGKKYEGGWKDGKKHGKGTETFASGDRYEGDFACGIISGYGVYYYANGCTYKGEWKEGVKHGEGTETYASGDKYVGNFACGLRNSYGVCYYADGSTYKGMWCYGQKHGDCTYFYANGDRYEGSFIFDNRCYGIYYYADGRTVIVPY